MINLKLAFYRIVAKLPISHSSRFLIARLAVELENQIKHA